MTTATRTIRIVIDSANANRQISAITQNTDRASAATSGLTVETNKLSVAIRGVIAGYSSVYAIKQISELGDEYAKITGLLRNATSTQAEFNVAMDSSREVALAANASLTTTVETYAALKRATDGSGRSQAELFGILETINKSIALTSPNAESAAAALTQFGQALGGDFKAGAQELNSILEQAPGLAEAVARGLGVATKELKTMGAEGQLSAEKVLGALQKVADDVDVRFEKIPQTVSGNLTKIRNEMIVAFGEANTSAPIIEILSAIAKNLDLVASGATAVASVYAARLIPVIQGKVAALVADFNATKAAAAQENLAAIGATRRANAESVNAKALLDKARAESVSASAAVAAANDAAAAERMVIASKIQRLSVVRASIAGEIALEQQRMAAQINDIGRAKSSERLLNLQSAQSVAINQITRAETALAVESSAVVAAQNAQAVALQRANIAAAASAEATTLASAANARLSASSVVVASTSTIAGAAIRGLGTAMAFLGGPLGVIFLAASALAYFITKSDETKKSLIDTNSTIDATIEKFNSMKSAGKAKFLNDTLIDIRETNKEIVNAGKKLDEAMRPKGRAGVNGAAVLDARAEIEALNDKLKKLQEIRLEIEKPQLTRDAEAQRKSLRFSAPDISDPDIKVDKLLEAGYRAEEKLAEQHFQNMKDIESEFWDSVNAEGRASDQIEEAQSVTESMKLELASRLQVAQFYRDANLAGIEGSYEREAALLNASAEEKRAQVDQRWAEDSQKRADQEAEALIQIGVNLQARAEIMAAYDEQERVAKEIHTAELTAIEEAAAERRRQLDEAEANRKIKLGFDIGKASLAALQTFGSQSEKTQKRLAKVSIAVDTAQGVAAGVKLGWPLGIPAVLWAVINGAKAMSALNSAGSISPASAGSIPSMPTTATSNEPKFEQKRVIEIKGAIDGNSLVKVSDLPEIFGNTDTVVLLAGAQAEAQRRGVI